MARPRAYTGWRWRLEPLANGPAPSGSARRVSNQIPIIVSHGYKEDVCCAVRRLGVRAACPRQARPRSARGLQPDRTGQWAEASRLDESVPLAGLAYCVSLVLPRSRSISQRPTRRIEQCRRISLRKVKGPARAHASSCGLDVRVVLATQARDEESALHPIRVVGTVVERFGQPRCLRVRGQTAAPVSRPRSLTSRCRWR